MNKNLKFGFIFLALLLLSKRIASGLKDNRKMIFEAVKKKYGAKKAGKFEMVYNALKAVNLTDLQFHFVLAQMMQETGVFLNENGVFEKNNNASGISWSGSPGQKATGAVKGSARKIEETGNYAKYPNLTAWTKDYMRVLNKGAYPLKATTVEDYVHRLVQNKYFDTNPARYPTAERDYLRNMKAYLKLITNV